MFKWLKFKDAALTRSQNKKYEMFWFAREFGFSPAEYRAMSFSDRLALKAITAAHRKYDEAEAQKRKARGNATRPIVLRRKRGRR